MKNLIILFVLITLYTSCFGQSVNVVLKNGKVLSGKVVEENSGYLMLVNDLGQIKVDRDRIESINYAQQTKITYKTKHVNDTTKTDNQKFALNDVVVIHLKSGEVVSGTLIAKSLDMVMIQTEIGTLTIPKRDLQLLEYVSSEYAERGEIVIVNLTNGTKFEGNIYYEDSNNLSIDTKIGRLTISKENLRSIEYTGESGQTEKTLVDQYTVAESGRATIPSRLDVFSFGYIPKFGDNFRSGFGLGFTSKFLLSQSQGFYFSAESGIRFNYFGLNSEAFQNEPIPVSAKGGAFITTLSAGVSFAFFPQASSFYEFYIAPAIEAHIIYQSLERDYPSFPDLNTKESKTKFNFGFGNKIGLDLVFDAFRLGISYDMHFIFGEEDFNKFSINFTKEIF